MQKKYKVLVGFLFFFMSSMGSAANNTTMTQADKFGTPIPSEKFKFLGPAIFYNYFDFKFDSTEGSNFNRFNGHSNLYGLTGNSIYLGYGGIIAGLGVYRVETSFDSEQRLSPQFLTTVKQTVKNNTLYGHIGKPLSKNFYVDATAGYGQNKVTALNDINPGTTSALSGSANYKGYNWFGSLAGYYTKPWQRFIFKGNAIVLYNKLHYNTYAIKYTTPVTVNALTNKSIWVSENAEVHYRLNKAVTPYLTAGLSQVPHVSSNRASLTTPVVGGLPQLNAQKSGYRVGGGVRIAHKEVLLTLQYKYYDAGHVYRSNQGGATLSYFIA